MLGSLRRRGWLLVITVLNCGSASFAAQYRGRVLTHDLPVPGATVSLTQAARLLTTTTDQGGRYLFPDVAPGTTWKLHIEMTGFISAEAEITVPEIDSEHASTVEMLSKSQLLALAMQQSAPVMQLSAATAPSEEKAAAKPTENQPIPEASNAGLLINGSVNNAATSQISLDQAFGNQRRASRSLYTGGLAVIAGNAAFDARPLSLSGVPQRKADYNRLSEVLTFGGPLNIPRVLDGRTFHGPNLFLVYERTRNREASIETGLVPTAAQRNATDPVAANLLTLYPLPNIQAGNNYNYQTQVLNNTHGDLVQLRADRNPDQRDTLHGAFTLQSIRRDTTNLFNFRDRTSTLGTNADVNWQHLLRAGLYLTLGYSFSRVRTNVAPFFQDRVNVAGDAGVGGVLDDPYNWGPPTLVFSSGISSLSDAEARFDRNRSDQLTIYAILNRGRHNVIAGGDFRRQEFNYFSQSNPRGTFTFTGAAFGSDLADLMAGVPDTSAINYGNADKYLRQSVSDMYLNDDWRLRPELSLNFGLRWEYSAPITELKQRLANLDVAPDFSAVSTVVASSPKGATTGQVYPSSLLRPDYTHVEPRVGLAWRPLPASSLVVRAGYGIYADTSVYQTTVLSLAEQSPFALSLQANNSDCPQTLRMRPHPCGSGGTTLNTFAVDPNFRVGYAQSWNLSAQRDLPGALVATISYSGVKGTRGIQDFLPNTYPSGVTAPDLQAPVGFLYRSSNGNSTRQAGTVQVRRRMRDGLTATAEYTISHSIDDDSILGGQGSASRLDTGMGSNVSAPTPTAQNWLNLRGERGNSTFDQRHLLRGTLQYTTGVGLHGGTLLVGWRRRAYKDWTVALTSSVGSGLPETPVYLSAVNGTGYTGSIRPNLTGADTYAGAPAGAFLNAAAFTAPAAGAWGNAGRDSLRGPGTYTFDTSLAHTFRVENRFYLDIRADATNILNHVVYASYNNVINPNLLSPLFGVPTAAQPMRNLQFTARLRF